MKRYSRHEIILQELVEVLENVGLVALREVAVHMGDELGFVDLVTECQGQRLAIEVEMSPRRVGNDVRKAAALNAWLWIVVKNAQLREAVRRRLADHGVRERFPWICVLTIGQAKQRLTNYSCLFRLPLSKTKQT